MPKRSLSQSEASIPPPKRKRTTKDILSSLSDELVLRILHFLPTETLTICQRLSHRFYTLAGDSQLWKSAYYDRFVRARANRLPGRGQSKDARFSSKLSKWLDEGDLVRRGQETNWKRQYKIRHKWANGTCGMSEIPVPERATIPPLVARLHQGIVYSADSNSGLRAWAYKGDQRLLCQHIFQSVEQNVERKNRPSSIAIDSTEATKDTHKIILGFQDGGYGVYSFNISTNSFRILYEHLSSSRGALTAVASSWPYIMTMTESQVLSLYHFPSPKTNDDCRSPILLTSLKSGTVWAPLSIRLQQRGSLMIVSIAYSVPTFSQGWSAGVQELHIDHTGEVVHSRLASALDQGFRPLARYPDSDLSLPTPEINEDNIPSRSLSVTKPTSLSYSHPYLLLSHADNTLTLFMVNSTATTLSISNGKRLWGHTSGIFGVHVGGRGKAVSVSTHGEEVRVWQLEAAATRKDQSHAQVYDLSVQVSPQKKGKSQSSKFDQQQDRRQDKILVNACRPESELSVTRGWVGFDEEHVVVLRGHSNGNSQALTIYDFT